MQKDGARRILLLAANPSDARDLMIEGDSGILAISPASERPIYLSQRKLLKWPNGAIGYIRSGADPKGIRGPHVDTAWIDELAKFQYPKESWDNLMFALRRPMPNGEQPRGVVTTTPRRIPTLSKILERPTMVVTRGTLYDNIANLAPAFVREIMDEYEGTYLGRQEIHGELLKEVEGALWTLVQLEKNRRRNVDRGKLVRLVVSVDPAGSSRIRSSETGIIVAGVDRDGHGYALDDLSGRYTPDQWAEIVVEAYYEWEADRVIGEVNYGGDLVESNIRAYDADVPFKAVRASRGKAIRAEPVAAKDERGQIHIVRTLPMLEDQLTTWVPGDASPDRLDAYVWAFTELLKLGASKKKKVRATWGS